MLNKYLFVNGWCGARSAMVLGKDLELLPANGDRCEVIQLLFADDRAPVAVRGEVVGGLSLSVRADPPPGGRANSYPGTPLGLVGCLSYMMSKRQCSRCP